MKALRVQLAYANTLLVVYSESYGRLLILRFDSSTLYAHLCGSVLPIVAKLRLSYWFCKYFGLANMS